MPAKDYMPRAAGLTLGSQGEEVTRLQHYLREFGYLESPALDNFVAQPRLRTIDAPEGRFDDNTAQALRRFQAFQHLPVTGELDVATLAHLGKPRCGFPDIGEFALTGRRWPGTDLTYRFDEITTALPREHVVAAIKSALSLWERVTPLRFTERGAGQDSDIIIRFVAGAHGDFNDFDGGGGVLAHAFFPPLIGASPEAIQGDAHFDEAENWSVEPIPSFGTIDLATVAAHEFGHSLGLGHSSIGGTLMFPTYDGPHRFLSNDDIAGVQALYGPRPLR